MVQFAVSAMVFIDMKMEIAYNEHQIAGFSRKSFETTLARL